MIKVRRSTERKKKTPMITPLSQLARMSILLISLISLSLVQGMGAATLQDGGSSSPRPVRVDLGFGQSPPGGTVVISVIFTPPRGVQVGSTTNEITFPTQRLSFQEAIRGLSAEVAEAEIITEVRQDDQDPESSILKLTVKAKAAMALPRGTLVDVMFNISDQAELGETIVLKNSASAMSTDDPPQSIDPVSGSDGELIIDETAIVFSCLFFMH